MNNSFDIDKMITDLTLDENIVLRVYDDANGKPIIPGTTVIGNPTIGIGRNLRNGITTHEAQFLCENDIMNACDDLDRNCSWWRDLDPVRQRCMINLRFNMGMPKLLTFVKFLDAMKHKNFSEAYMQLTSSLWYSQVGVRGPRIANRILRGTVA